jgi:3D (Asp-Asp-Asp) domain-containing protein
MKLKTFIMSTITGLIILGVVVSTIYFSVRYHDMHQLLTDAQDQAIFLQNKLETTETKLQKQTDKNSKLQQELEVANQTINDLKGTEYRLVYIGNFKYTYYCDERIKGHICGGSGVTASGAPTQVGKTIAVDRSVIPLGTTVYIEGVGFRVAQDTGSAVKGKHVDILVKGHQEALSQTNVSGGVWILTTVG